MNKISYQVCTWYNPFSERTEHVENLAQSGKIVADHPNAVYHFLTEAKDKKWQFRFIWTFERSLMIWFDYFLCESRLNVNLNIIAFVYKLFFSKAWFFPNRAGLLPECTSA